MIRAVLGLFEAFVRASFYNSYAAKIGVWIGCMRRIKMIPKVFFLNKICVDAKLEFNFLHK